MASTPPEVSSVHVVVRVKPHTEQDLRPADPDSGRVAVRVTTGPSAVELARAFAAPKAFQFKHILGPEANQAEAYAAVAENVVQDVCDGVNGTVLCYGQTGSGKTHTMFGNLPQWSKDNSLANRGLVPRAAQDLFRHVAMVEAKGNEAKVSVSFVEVYMERVVDLLSHGDKGTALAVREDPEEGVFVEGATEVVVRTPQQLLTVIQEGVSQRTTHSTSMNARSSRSHALLRIKLRQTEPVGDRPADEEGLVDMEVRVRQAVLTMVDLAGSERVSKSGSMGMRLEEVKKINRSIAALGNCVAALAGCARSATPTHVPLRDSKLTRLLTNALRGNSRTVLCATVSSVAANSDETFSTLTFAARARAVQTKPKRNETTDVQPVAPAPLAHAILGVPTADGRPQTTNEARLHAELVELRRLLAGTDVGRQLASATTTVPATPAHAPVAGAGTPAASMAVAEIAADREMHLTQRYTRITRRLQEEVASQNVLIAQLQYALAQSQHRARQAEDALARTGTGTETPRSYTHVSVATPAAAVAPSPMHRAAPSPAATPTPARRHAPSPMPTPTPARMPMPLPTPTPTPAPMPTPAAAAAVGGGGGTLLLTPGRPPLAPVKPYSHHPQPKKHASFAAPPPQPCAPPPHL